MPQMKTPGPDHPITLEAAPGRIQARYAGHVIADSDNVIWLKEADYPPVAYFPRGDVDMAYMARTDHHTHCPYKGEASYYSLNMDGRLAENGVWTYEEPYPAMTGIQGRLAFYSHLVQIQAVPGDAFTRDGSIDATIRHTDAGDGTSQAEHWPPTVDQPA